jgi:hypothetical protein
MGRQIMAKDTFQPVSFINPVIDAFPGSTGPATVIVHGCIACVNSSGFVEDYTSTSRPKVLGVVDNVSGNAGSTGDVVTTQGSINLANNLVTLVTEGRIDSIPFNSDLSADDVGKPAYAIDNFTLTPDPAASTNMSRVGVITKYYTSAKGEVKWNGYADNDGTLEKATVLTTSSSSIMMAIVNPLGVDVILQKFECVVTAGASSAHAVSVGIAATSTTPASDVVATGAIAMGTTGVYGTAKTTNFFGEIYWGATKYLTLSSSSAIGDAGDVGTLAGYIKLAFKPV